MTDETLQFRLQIDCGNDAFGGDLITAEFTLADLLRDVAHRLEAGEGAEVWRNIKDHNGNIVGTFALKPKDRF